MDDETNPNLLASQPDDDDEYNDRARVLARLY